MNRLTACLMREERQVRVQRRQRRLYAMLPAAERHLLYGREQALAHFRRIWQAGSPKHIFVTGAAGIGKTALVQAAVREQIEADAVDYLMWVKQPGSLAALKDQIVQALRLQQTALTLREYALRYELLVVVDGLEGLTGEWSGLEGLLADLSTERVVLVHRRYRPLRQPVAHLVVRALNCEAALTLLRWLLPVEIADGVVNDADLLALWRETGGHPQALRQAVDRLRCSEYD